MNPQYDPWQLTFFCAAALLILAKAWQGWRMGIARQLVNILALVAAYVIGYAEGGSMAPLLRRTLDWPDRTLAVVGAVLLGFIVYFGVSFVGTLLFKKTSQHNPGMTRLGYGFLGGAAGALFGVFLVWIGILSIRLLGTVAEARIAAEKNPRFSSGFPTPTPTPEPSQPGPGAFVLGFAHMKESLEQGPAGAMMQHVDPIPGTLYGLLHKMGAVVSDDNCILRFRSFPGVEPLLANPKIAALENDPEIARYIANRDFFGLLQNRRILAVANDPEIGELLRKFEFEKALDYALRKPEKETAKARD